MLSIFRICLFSLVALSECLFGQAGAGSSWTLSGKVTSPDGPVRGHFVVALSDSQRLQAVTDNSGNYRIQGTVGGQFTVIANPMDHFAEPGRPTIRIRPGEAIAQINFDFHRGGTLSGKVLTAEGKPVANALLFAFRKSVENGINVYSQDHGAKSNDRGQYSIDGLANGEYVVAVSTVTEKPLKFRAIAEKDRDQYRAEGYRPYTFAPRESSPVTASVVRIREAESFATLDVTMEKVPLRCLHVNVIPSAGGNGVTGVQTNLLLKQWWESESPMIADAVLKNPSSVAVCGLPEGEYTLHLHDFSRSPEKGYGYSRVRLAIGRQNADLGSQPIAEPVALRGQMQLTGATDKRPNFQGIVVRLLRQNRSLLFTDRLGARVREDGGFEIDGIYADGYRLEVANLPKGWFVARVQQGLRDVTGQTLRSDGGEVSITLDPRGAMLAGVVEEGSRTEKKVPIPGATVFLLRLADQKVFPAQTDQNGNFTFAHGLPKGDYRIVAVSGLPEGLKADVAYGASLAVNGTHVALEESEGKQLSLELGHRYR